jgi:hypothetical protein
MGPFWKYHKIATPMQAGHNRISPRDQRGTKMEKYVAIPVEVIAAVIEDTRHVVGFPEVKIDGAWMKLPAGADARYTTQVGDYYVVQADGYVYVNPKYVFERKYRRFVDTLMPPPVAESDPKAPVSTSLAPDNTGSDASSASDPGTTKIAELATAAAEKNKTA